jgi:hypothetical protein
MNVFAASHLQAAGLARLDSDGAPCPGRPGRFSWPVRGGAGRCNRIIAAARGRARLQVAPAAIGVG